MADDVLQQLQEKIRTLEQSQTTSSVEAALTEVRRYLERPPYLLDNTETVARISHLASAARDAGHKQEKKQKKTYNTVISFSMVLCTSTSYSSTPQTRYVSHGLSVGVLWTAARLPRSVPSRHRS